MLWTVGHGTLAEGEFAALLHDAGIEEVLDIRAFPGSRRNPQFGRDAMASWLPGEELGYSWVPDLGGRRRSVPDSKHVALRHPSFRAYADYMETAQFRDAIDELLADEGGPRALMCSESVWWRCHRRLVSDYLTLVRAVDVRHVMHDNRIVEHPPTSGVRVAGDGLVYDVVEDTSSPGH